MMKWKDAPGRSVPCYIFTNLEKTGFVSHGFTTKLYRDNGTVHDFFQPLLRRDSDPREVEHCQQLLLDQFGIDADHLVASAQKHTSNIHLITEADLGPQESRPSLEAIDGLITNLPGVLLQTFGADCPSVYLTDPVHRAIGLCHSGRKGTQRHIAAVMLRKMTEAFGTDPKDVQAAISPGICLNCYEVGDEVAEDFIRDYNSREDSPEDSPAASGKYPLAGSPVTSGECSPNGSPAALAKLSSLLAHHQDIGSVLHFQSGKYHIDLSQAIRDSLTAAGVPADQIEQSDLCTKCRCDRFYSFRAEGHISNENCALLMISKPAAPDAY